MSCFWVAMWLLGQFCFVVSGDASQRCSEAMADAFMLGCEEIRSWSEEGLGAGDAHRMMHKRRVSWEIPASSDVGHRQSSGRGLLMDATSMQVNNVYAIDV